MGLKTQDCDVRAAAMNAVQGSSDIPIEVIETWAESSGL